MRPIHLSKSPSPKQSVSHLFINKLEKWDLLASTCLRRQWNQRLGIVCVWVAAPTCGCTYSPILDRQALSQLLQRSSVMLPLAVTLSPLFTSLSAWFDSKPPVTSVCSYSFPICRVDIACLQIWFKFTVEYFLRILSMVLTWPSQRSRLWPSNANILGTPACARKSLFRTRSCQVMPKILLRKRRWKVLSLRSWQE